MNEKFDRVLVYVDGFNLYFGIVEAGFNKSKWLDIASLVKSYLTSNQQLVAIKYFTSRITNNPSKQKRQSTFLEALETTGIQIIYGLYKSIKVECNNCGHTWSVSNEKMTDVNIATHILSDDYADKYDTAILISGDSDLVPPLREVNKRYPGKNVSIFFPPCRHNNTVAAAAKGFLILGRKRIIDNQLPERIIKADGYTLTKPSEW